MTLSSQGFATDADGAKLVSWSELTASAVTPGQPPLRGEARFQSSNVFSSGAYVADVAIDRATGALSVTRLVAVDDAGTLINPLLVHGQVIGGAVQALGECLTEEVTFDESRPEHQRLAAGLQPAHRGRDPADRHRRRHDAVAPEPARGQGRRRGRRGGDPPGGRQRGRGRARRPPARSALQRRSGVAGAAGGGRCVGASRRLLRRPSAGPSRPRPGVSRPAPDGARRGARRRSGCWPA